MHATALRAYVIAITLFTVDSAAPAQELESIQPSRQAQLEVVGEGTVTAQPDMARVHVGIATEAASALEALDANNGAMEKLLEVLDRAGIAQRDVQTVQFSVSPRYRRERRSDQQGEQRIVGCQVTRTVRVVVRALKTLRGLLDEVVSAGSNRIDGISFDSSQREKLLDEARRGAVNDAKRKAQLYADAAGVELGHIVLLSEEPVRVPRPELAGVRVAAAVGVPVAPGELELRATIHIAYAIKH